MRDFRQDGGVLKAILGVVEVALSLCALVERPGRTAKDDERVSSLKRCLSLFLLTYNSLRCSRNAVDLFVRRTARQHRPPRAIPRPHQPCFSLARPAESASPRPSRGASPPSLSSPCNADELSHPVVQIVVCDGEMVCPQCEHVFKIKDSIPNMVRFLFFP